MLADITLNNRTRRGLPESATALSPLICVWPERFLFIGKLNRVGWHRHAAVVASLALEGKLRIRVRDRHEWWTCGGALIPAGCMHALDLRGNLVAVLYNDPHRPYYRKLSACERTIASFGFAGEDRLRETLSGFYVLTSARQSEQRATLEDELSRTFEARERHAELEPRIRHVLAVMQNDLTRNYPLSALSATVALSPSRLQHLFHEELGVPLRRLRNWMRFRRVLEEIAAGTSFTHAAIAAGFASSTHFSHAFKTMFGVPAASLLASRVSPRIMHLA